MNGPKEGEPFLRKAESEAERLSNTVVCRLQESLLCAALKPLASGAGGRW